MIREEEKKRAVQSEKETNLLVGAVDRQAEALSSAILRLAEAGGEERGRIEMAEMNERMGKLEKQAEEDKERSERQEKTLTQILAAVEMLAKRDAL